MIASKWERALVTPDTHTKAQGIAKDTGLRLWAVYAAAIDCLNEEQNLPLSELGDLHYGGGMHNETQD